MILDFVKMTFYYDVKNQFIPCSIREKMLRLIVSRFLFFQSNVSISREIALVPWSIAEVDFSEIFQKMALATSFPHKRFRI